MIDSVLKGTGNSRFLKSAVPAGTSWADALAMLQAGTFPIDFNGINTEGFQQVGTPLNKANLLKDATAAQIGLPPSTTPDGMFQALGNTGELHVWRKTTVTTEPVPAGYKLGDVLTHGSSYIACQINGSSYVTFVIREAASITVNDNGIIEASWGSNISVAYGASYTFTPNRFVKIVSINANAINSNFAAGDVVWVPSDGKIYGTYVQQNDGSYLYYMEFTKCQKVNAHGIIPAGTTTTYPVSTNPNAYQEGSDAKPAGYTLGEVVTGSFSLGTTAGTQTYTYDSTTSLDVGDDGTVSLQNPSSGSFGTMGGLSPGDNLSTIQTFILGKFVRCTGINTSYVSGTPDTKYPFNVVPSDIVYIPSNANVTKTSNVIYIDRYQPVTGYAAIPAGTTIEYLGKLGDKARVQVLSYVGTGTYGSSNPNSLTFDFVPKLVIVALSKDKNNNPNVMPSPSTGWKNMFLWTYGMKMTSASSSEIHFNNDGKKLSWYAYNYASSQCNDSGSAYTAIAIG